MTSVASTGGNRCSIKPVGSHGNRSKRYLASAWKGSSIIASALIRVIVSSTSISESFLHSLRAHIPLIAIRLIESPDGEVEPFPSSSGSALRYSCLALYSNSTWFQHSICAHAKATRSIKALLASSFKHVQCVQLEACEKALTCRDSSL